MKQLGNLAIVCAQRQDVLLQVLNGKVTVHAGKGSNKDVFYALWDDDRKINEMVYELNFGRFAPSKEERLCTTKQATA